VCGGRQQHMRADKQQRAGSRLAITYPRGYFRVRLLGYNPGYILSDSAAYK
jgi:hypothetical protein